MSSSTARLGLKRPDGSDPFLRSDFVDNLNKLDANPGYVPCLSTSRPAWGAAQAGMLISETDTGRILRWTGSAWAPPTNLGQAWSIGTNPGLILANNTASTITVAASVPVPRACRMIVMLTARLALGALHEQAGSLDVWIDSTTAGVGGVVNWFLPSTGDASNSIATYPMVVGERSVAAGNHSVAIRVVNGNMGFDLGVTFVRGLIMLSE